MWNRGTGAAETAVGTGHGGSGAWEEPGDGEMAPCRRVPTGARTATPASERVDAVPERVHRTLSAGLWQRVITRYRDAGSDRSGGRDQSTEVKPGDR